MDITEATKNDKNGTVDLQELEDYVSVYGLVANLNAAS